jgi:hypothetical protein
MATGIIWGESCLVALVVFRHILVATSDVPGIIVYPYIIVLLHILIRKDGLRCLQESTRLPVFLI